MSDRIGNQRWRCLSCGATAPLRKDLRHSGSCVQIPDRRRERAERRERTGWIWMGDATSTTSPFSLFERLLQDWHRLRMRLIEYEERDCPEYLAVLDREFHSRLVEYREAERETGK